MQPAKTYSATHARARNAHARNPTPAAPQPPPLLPPSRKKGVRRPPQCPRLLPMNRTKKHYRLTNRNSLMIRHFWCPSAQFNSACANRVESIPPQNRWHANDFAVLLDARATHARTHTCITMCPELRVQSSRRYKTRFAAGQPCVDVCVYHLSGTP